MATRIRIHSDALVLIQDEVDREVDRRIVQPMAQDMRRFAPYLTGALYRSIRSERVAAGLHRIWAGDVAAGVDYHLHQEYGTSKMAAQPYIRPAVYQRRGD